MANKRTLGTAESPQPALYLAGLVDGSTGEAVEVAQRINAIDEAVVALEGGGGGGGAKPSYSGFVAPPEVLDAVAGNSVFTLAYPAKFIMEGMVLHSDGSFTYLQMGDMVVSGDSVTVNNVTFVDGDKVKFTYAVDNAASDAGGE